MTLIVSVLLLVAGDDVETRRLADLEKQLTHVDSKVRLAAAGELFNGTHRKAPPEALAALLIRQLQTPAQADIDSRTAQGFVMEYLSRHCTAHAQPALPQLLRFVTDDKVDVYLRSQAVEACARIGPGDKRVVDAFITALENPNPTTTSGVHDRAIERLGDMGKAAWPAKKAIAKMLEHRWYHDRAYDALGKLARDDDPGTGQAYLDRLRRFDGISHEDASAAMLHLAELGKKDKEIAAAARTVLWAIVAGRGNDVTSRGAFRALEQIGPGSDPAAARLIVRGLFAKWDPTIQGDMAGHAERVLVKFDPKDPAAIPVLVDAFAEALKPGQNWPIQRDLAIVLARYGKEAFPAAPHLIRAIQTLPPYKPSSYGHDLLEGFTLLAAALGDEASVRTAVLEGLNANSKLMKSSAEHAWVVQGRLLLTLSEMKLSRDEAERKRALGEVKRGLAQSNSRVFAAAAQVVQQDPALRPGEVAEVLPLLTRVLAFDFKFGADPKDHAWIATFRNGKILPSGQRAAMHALAALGHAARPSLPALEAWAKRPLEPRRSDFLPEPAVNLAIRDAINAVATISAK